MKDIRKSPRAKYLHKLLRDQYKMYPLTIAGTVIPGQRVRHVSEISRRALGSGTGFVAEIWGNNTQVMLLVVLDDKRPPRMGIALWSFSETKMVHI